MSDKNIELIQEALHYCGMPTGKIDGIMGADTKGAIKQFQEKQGLAADGIAGPNTKAKLAEQLGSAMGRIPQLITELQGSPNVS
ncbi:MAG: peptidoglycan-binding protein [Deltaproteobacteria bacterium]|jgi:peptidoglycan hydrolase-like protein with peptidoglycan-binding domain|nr:peptidoglycan-binding protein [Deltaproteobacteria bacterium]